MNRDNSLVKILTGVVKGDEDDERHLYRLLYTRFHLTVKKYEHNKIPAMEVFQDGVYLFMMRLKKGWIQPEKYHEKVLSKLIDNAFKRILYQRLFDPERSVYSLIVGVREGIEQANSNLFTLLSQDKIKNYTRYLDNKYNMGILNNEDLHSEASQAMLKNIVEEKFTLQENDANAFNLNKTLKYYRTILFGIANKKTRGQKNNQVLPEDISDRQQLELSAPPEEISDSTSLSEITYEALEYLDQVGQYILKQMYLHKKKPIQIAKIIPFEAFQSTAQIVAKKNESLNKLRKEFADLLYQHKQGNLLQQFQLISDQAITVLKEPCLTILKFTLSPIQKSPLEVAELIQSTLDKDLAAKLQTAKQVSKRKHRCLQDMQEEIWKQLF